MVKLTLIARVADGLPLAEGLETEKNADLDAYKQQAKARGNALCHVRASLMPAQTLFKRLAGGGHPPARMSVESGAYCFQCVASHHATQPLLGSQLLLCSYLIEHGVCYLTLADRAYPKKLAYQASWP